MLESPIPLPEGKEWFSPEEIAELMKLSPATVRKMLKEDGTTVLRLAGGQVRVKKVDLRWFLRARIGPMD